MPSRRDWVLNIAAASRPTLPCTIAGACPLLGSQLHVYAYRRRHRIMLQPVAKHTATAKSRKPRLYANLVVASQIIFTARRYVSAVYAVVVCPPVRPSVVRQSVCPFITSRHCIKTTALIKLVFGMEASYTTDPTLCIKEIWVSSKIRVLTSVTLSLTSDLENFAAASRSRCQQTSSSSKNCESVKI